MSSLLQKQQHILNNIVQKTDLTLIYEKLDGRNTFEPLIRPQDTLGEGLNGKIIKLRNKITNKIVAMKQLPADSANSLNEITLHYLAQENNDFVTKVESIFLNYNRQTGKQWFYIMMECMEGDLFSFIEDNWGKGGFSEGEVCEIMRMMVNGVNCLHNELGIAHRDLKPENMLLNNKTLKISDFGFAKESLNSKSKKQLKTACYTPFYAPPEVFGTETYDFACDIWSLGVIFYFMLTMNLPFTAESSTIDITPRMMKKIELADYPKEEIWEYRKLSVEAKDLIARMLCPDPEFRIRIEDVMVHGWFGVAEMGEKREMSEKSEKQLDDDFDGIEGQNVEKPKSVSHPGFSGDINKQMNTFLHRMREAVKIEPFKFIMKPNRRKNKKNEDANTK